MQLGSMETEDREKRIQEMMEELKSAIAEALQAFTRGDCDAAFLRNMLSDLGVDMGCSDESLNAMRIHPSTRYCSLNLSYCIRVICEALQTVMLAFSEWSSWNESVCRIIASRLSPSFCLF